MLTTYCPIQKKDIGTDGGIDFKGVSQCPNASQCKKDILFSYVRVRV